MARNKCGCQGDSCSCKIVAGRGTRIQGSGNLNNPYVIDSYPMALIVQDSSTVDLTLDGTGTEGDPWVVSAEVSGSVATGRWASWSGTQAAYDALGSWDNGTLYIILEP